MRNIFKYIPVLGLVLGCTAAADAQWGPGHYQNAIRDSGNGAYNQIHLSNHGGYGYGQFNNQIINSGNGAYNHIDAFNHGVGHGQAFAPGYGAGYGGRPIANFVRGLIPDVNVNVIANSGNGVGNVIQAINGGGSPFGGPFGQKLNLNVITNSGNGAYNHLGAFNR